jgi:hypothetical protein
LHRSICLALAFAAPLSGLSACHPAKPAIAQVVFAADQLGFIAPCGCSAHQLGGAARASAYLRRAAVQAPTLFVEGGNMLFKKLALTEEEREQAKDKALALVRSWSVGASAAAARAAAAGPYDEALGVDFTREAFDGWPLLSPGAGRLVDLNGQKFGVLALTSTPPGGAAAQALRSQGAVLVVAIVEGALAQAATWGAAARADLVLQSGVRDPEQDTDEAAQTTGTIPVFRVKDKGRGLLLLTLRLPAHATGGLVVLEGDKARAARADELVAVIKSNEQRLTDAAEPLRGVLQAKIAELTARRESLLKQAPSPPLDRPSLEYEFVDLDDQKPEAPESEQIVASYTSAIGKKNLAAQARKVCPSVKPGELSYVGVDSCRECHSDAVAVYEGTKHSHATQTLIDKGRQYDLDCVGCHVLGYGKPGGVCRLDQVGARANVQCESCHGPGSLHVDSAGDTPVPVRRPGYDDCYRCHDPDNDTGFNRETYVSHYLPGILGPGHGRPLTKR